MKFRMSKRLTTEQYFILRVKTSAVIWSGRPSNIFVDLHVRVTFSFKQALEMFLVE